MAEDRNRKQDDILMRRSSLGGKVLYGPVTSMEQETDVVLRKK